MYDDVLKTVSYCKYKVFCKDDDLDQIYRLRYECYLAEDTITKNARRIMSDPRDENPNCVHVAVQFGDILLSAIRLHLNSDWSWDSPTIDAFPDILERIPDGQTMLDLTRFVVRPEAREVGLPLHLVTMRIATLAAMFYDIDVALAPVRAEHFAFYRRYLGYDVWAMPRPYPELRKPLGLLAAKPRECRDKILERFPFFGPTESVIRSEIYFPDLPEVFPLSAQPKSRVA